MMRDGAKDIIKPERTVGRIYEGYDDPDKKLMAKQL